MIVTWEKQEQRFVLNFEPEKEDITEGLKSFRGVTYKMAKNTCYISVPLDWDIDKTHPDLLAAVVILIIEPFVGKRIVLPRSVSLDFHNVFLDNFHKEVGPVDSDLPKRTAQDNSRPSLAFSGGVDSVSAAILLPKNTVCLFVDRDSSGEVRPGRYNKSAALFAIEGMKKLGHDVKAVLTDYEFIRDPVGFAWGISSAVPPLLLADYYNLDSLAFGMILESAYGIGDESFREPNHTWRDILVAAGLPYNLVTAGFSEVATAKFLIGFPEYYILAQSCIRGNPGQPCQRCLKCFRKSLLEKAIKKENPEDLDLENKSLILEIFNHITKTPIHHENIYTYALSNYKGTNRFLNLFAKKVRARRIKSKWLENWYSSSALLMFSKYRSHIVHVIQQHVRTMDTKDEKNLRSWNPHTVFATNGLKSFFYKRNAKKFFDYLSSQTKQPKKPLKSAKI